MKRWGELKGAALPTMHASLPRAIGFEAHVLRRLLQGSNRRSRAMVDMMKDVTRDTGMIGVGLDKGNRPGIEG